MGIVRDFRDFMMSRRDAARPDVEKQSPPDGNEGSCGSGAFSIYENNNITIRGEPSGYDFSAILRDPQNNDNMHRLYELAEYYKESDPYVGASIQNVYVPFTVAEGYRLTGVDESVKKKYLDHYEKIGFSKRMVSIFDQYYTFGNVFIYLMPDGSMYTLPPNRCRIAEVCLNGEPIIEFDTLNILNQDMSATEGASEEYLDDLKARLKGLPPEVVRSLTNTKTCRNRWVQLDPENAYALQMPKPDWERYAVPTIAKCLYALGRKARINDYEYAQLLYGIKGFLMVKVGDKDKDSGMNKPDQRHIDNAATAFDNALKGGRRVVVPWYCNAEFITVDTKTLFDNDKYSGVNQEIMSAFGISGVISLGQQESGSYGQAKLSLDTAALRIEWAQRNFEALMNKINYQLSRRLKRIGVKAIPKFEFPRVDLTRDGSFQKHVYDLWMQGMVSNKTLLETYELDIAQESERRKSEADSGQDELFAPRQNAYTSNTSNNGTGQGGRPTLNDTERTSDPEKASTGSQPKPSNPNGSA